MTPFVFTLVVLSSFLHVLWNTLVKQSVDKVSFAWLTSVIGCAILIPVYAYIRWTRPTPGHLELLGWAAVSGFFEAFYIIFLFAAYKMSDLSLVYPLSRGVAPLVTLAAAGELVGDHVSTVSAVAVVVIAIGVVSVGLSSRSAGQANRKVEVLGMLLSLGTGCMIAGYHLVDRKAMSLQWAPNPLEYLFLMHFFLALFLTLWICLFLRPGTRIFSEWATNRKGVVLVGIFTPLAYLFIIVALQFGNVTYVAAARNIGILMSLFVATFFLKEKVTSARTIGASLIAFGVAGLVLLGPAN